MFLVVQEEKLLVLEYCFNGNLKDYISRYRDYYQDEINPETGELQEEAGCTNYKSPTDSDQLPMSEFLNSMHASLESGSQASSSLYLLERATHIIFRIYASLLY